MEIRQNNLTGTDFEQIKALYPNLYKLKAGENPIKSLDVFKILVSLFNFIYKNEFIKFSICLQKRNFEIFLNLKMF